MVGSHLGSAPLQLGIKCCDGRRGWGHGEGHPQAMRGSWRGGKGEGPVVTMDMGEQCGKMAIKGDKLGVGANVDGGDNGEQRQWGTVGGGQWG